MKKHLKLIMIFFAIALAIIILKIPTNSYATTIIDKVYVGDIEEPEVGKLPDRIASTAKNYSIYDSVDWLDVTEGSYLYGNDVFEFGHVYRVVVWVKANSGYEFKTSGTNPDVLGYINVKSAKVNKAYEEAAYEVIELTYDYDLSCMKTIKLAGGAVPQVGEKYPARNSWYIPDGEHYTRGNRYRWYNDTDDREMSSSDVFESNKVYTLSIVFYPDDGYEFDIPGNMKAVLSDISKSNYSYTVERAGTSSSLEGARLVKFQFTNLTVRDIEISEISIENGVFPLTDEHPDYSWSAPAGAHYSISGTPIWISPNENNYELQPTDTFTKGQTYFLFIVLVSDYGYVFDSKIDDATLTDISDDFYIWSISSGNDQKSITVWLSMTAKNPTNTVYFNTVGGTEISSQTVDKGEKVIRPYPDPVKEGYTFVDWYVGARYYYVYDFSKPVTSDFTLYAKWRENINGLVENNGKLYYYVDGAVQSNYTGLVEYEDKLYYVQNGVVEGNVNGLTEINGVWYYLANSIVQSNFTSLVQYNNSWFYVENGQINWGFTGLVQHTNGSWFYVKSGKIDWRYTGLTKLNNTWYYVKNGKLDWSYTGLVQHTNGSWFYVKSGKLDWGYTGLVQHTNGSWFYIKSGKIDWSYTGLVQYNGSWFYVKSGKLDWGYIGLVQHTNGSWFYVKAGKLDWSYTGLVPYNNSLFYVKNGKLDWSYSGNVTYNGKTYTVKNGKAII